MHIIYIKFFNFIFIVDVLKEKYIRDKMLNTKLENKQYRSILKPKSYIQNIMDYNDKETLEEENEPDQHKEQTKRIHFIDDDEFYGSSIYKYRRNVQSAKPLTANNTNRNKLEMSHNNRITSSFNPNRLNKANYNNNNLDKTRKLLSCKSAFIDSRKNSVCFHILC